MLGIAVYLSNDSATVQTCHVSGADSFQNHLERAFRPKISRISRKRLPGFGLHKVSVR